MMDSRPWERWDDSGVAEEIDRYWLADRSGYEPIYRSVLSTLVQKHLLSPAEKVLEVGCGSGLIYAELVPEFIINSCYVGVDTSLKMLEIARKRFPTGQFIRGDAFSLQFPSNAFDIVICFEVLSHLPDIQKPIRELFRVASRLVIFTAWISPEPQTLNQTEEISGSKFLHNLYPHDEIVKTIREAAAGQPYVLETRILSDITWAYILFKGQTIKAISPGKMPDRVLPFQGLTNLLIRQLIAQISEKEQMEGSLKSREADLEQQQISLQKREIELGEVRDALSTREVELYQVKSSLEHRGMELAQAKDKHKAEKSQLEAKLSTREGELQDIKSNLESTSMELRQTKATLKSREGEIDLIRNKGMIIVNEVNSFRQRKIIRCINRVKKSDAWNDISPAFQQLKDDSLIFNKGLNGFGLQPSINLSRVPFVFYPMILPRPNLKGILLAPILDLPLTKGEFGIEIISPSGGIVVQPSIQASQIDESIPTRFDFLPIPDTNRGRFWLRVFVRDVNGPIRIFEWRKYPFWGLGKLQTLPFCAFLFENATS